MCDVGDMHLQLEVAVRGAADGDRVVEVARGLAIDGDNGQRAVVAAMAQLRGRDHRIEALRLLQDLDREAMRQMELANDDLDIHAEVVFVAEDFDDTPSRVFGWRGPLGDLHFNHDILQIGPFAATGFVAEDAVPSFPPFRQRRTKGWGTRVPRVCGRSGCPILCGIFCRKGWVGNDDLLRDLLVHGDDVVMPQP